MSLRAGLGAGAAAGALLCALVSAAMLSILAGAPAGKAAGYQGEVPGPVADIPALYLRLYIHAAQRYGLDWAVLAGIGKVECDHGRDPDPSCLQEGAVNAAGAGGPAQFLEQTWRRYGVDGDGDGVADRWDPADAIFAMANYLRASGAPEDYGRALYAYNNAQWYVSEVQRWAERYRRAAAGAAARAAASGEVPAAAGEALNGYWSGAGSIQYAPGAQALLSPSDPHMALVPAEAPPVVQAMVIAGNELQDLPYGAAGHPDPRGAASEDCSSAVNYVLYRAGVRPISEIVRTNPLAQDYTRWGDPGPGRWVTIYAATYPTDHVFIVIAGLRLDTSHHGTDIGPNRAEDGPRWRILGHIPTWARWSVRHPPGL